MKFSVCNLLASMFVVVTGCNVTQNISLPAEVEILTRSQWGAKDPVLRMHSHQIKRITIHHTAVKQNSSRSLSDKLKGLQKFSQQKSALSDGRIKAAWADIPYHFYIAFDGQIGEGRELGFVGDSNTPYDPTGHALIVLEGNFNVEPVTVEQLASLRRLTVALSRQFRVDSSMISGHKDHADTGCPGTALYETIPHLKKLINSQ